MPLPDSDVRSAIAETVSPPEEAGPLTPPFYLADLEHPWLGLESFREETRAYFFGRDTEVAEIHLRLRSHPLLLLYGRSGLGKTSILNAGLIPRLTEENHLPALHRFDFSNETFGPAGQLLFLLFISPHDRDHWRYEEAMNRFCDWSVELQKELALDLPEDFASRLWLRLHWRKELPKITHLILDQFEEVFTLGALRAGTEHEVRDALAIILEGAIPEPISRLIAEHDVLLDHFDPDSMPVRVILALRDDYVYALNRWRRHLPALGQNNFELRALRGLAAFDAVFEPGELRCKYRGQINEQNKVDTGLPPIVSKETAERIVRFVAKKDEDVPLEEIEAVPPILSLLCRELNERRFTEPAGTFENPTAQITFREGETDITTIITTFYERCLAERPEAVRIFIEEELVSPYSGARVPQDEHSILKVFADGCEIPGTVDRRVAAGYADFAKARACLKELVNQRLLTPLGGGDNPSYELIHDLLAAVAEKSRTAREERFEKEQADRRAEAETRAREDAEAVVKTVSAAKKAADELIKFLQYDLSETLEKVGRLDLMDALNTRIRKYHEDYPPDPSDLAAIREETVSLDQYGDVHSAQGDLAGAFKSYGDSLAIREKLAKQDPGNAGWQRDLSVSYEKVGDVQSAQGDLAGALKSQRDSLAIAEKLAKQDPGNAGWQRDLSVSYEKVGDVQSAQGDLAGALKSYGDSLAIREKLAEQDPGNAGWQRDLSVSYEKVGDVQSAQGDLAGALESHRDSLAIAEKLAKQDPGNAGWQRDLSVSYNKVGDVQSAQGDLTDALESHRDSLAIAAKLAKQDPGNAGWQRDLSVSYNKVGDVQSAQGVDLAALKSYSDSLAIREKLAKQDPGNAGWQRDMAFSYCRTGAALARAKPKFNERAQEILEKGRDILRQLKQRTGSTANQEQWLDGCDADIRAMRGTSRGAERRRKT